MNRLTDHVLNPFALKTFKHSCIVQVLAVLYHFDELEGQACGNRFFDVVQRPTTKCGRMDEHGHFGFAAAFVIGHDIFGQPNRLAGIGSDG